MAAPMAAGEDESSSYFYEEHTVEEVLEIRNVFDAGRCNVDSVTVYLDRAEVCRSVKSRVRKGENQITIKKLSPSIDKDSLRVEGKGPATILEVIYNVTALSDEEDENEQRLKDQKEQQHELQKNKEAMESRKRRIQKQREVLDGFADNLLRAQTETKEKNDTTTQVNISNTLDGNLLEGMVGFFDMYDRQATRLDDSMHEITIEMEKLDEQIAEADKILKEIENYKDEHMAREVIILMEASEDGEVELQVSYVVQKAKWQPRYDIRVFSGDSRMKIIYYGMIQQATGEDWDDAKITLSTAAPSVGGTVPDLGTQRLFFKHKYSTLTNGTGNELSPRADKTKSLKKKGRPQSVAGINTDYNRSYDEALIMPASDDRKQDEKGGLSEYQELPIEVKENMTSTQYDVVRRHSIQSDNAPHKVTIAIIDLNPLFEYECVPKRSPYAYLRAKVKNTSPYALLAGQTSIFLDNNFCAKADIKAVAPQEEFTCSLGADHGIKISYKPLHKSREHTSVIAKTSTWTHKQTIEVRNTHAESIKIVIMDQLPLAAEEKIKVNLVEPVIKHPEKYDRTKSTRLNRYNNIEWEAEIPAGETKELSLRYTVECPINEEVDASVLHLTHSHEI